jgi:hypothetical protein
MTAHSTRFRVCTRTAGTLALLPDNHLGRSLDGSPFLRTYSPFGAQTEVNECIALKSTVESTRPLVVFVPSQSRTRSL